MYINDPIQCWSNVLHINFIPWIFCYPRGGEKLTLNQFDCWHWPRVIYKFLSIDIMCFFVHRTFKKPYVSSLFLSIGQPCLMIYVAFQAHPALIVEIGLVLARVFHFNSLLVRLHLVKVLRTAYVCYRLFWTWMHNLWLYDIIGSINILSPGQTVQHTDRHTNLNIDFYYMYVLITT